MVEVVVVEVVVMEEEVIEGYRSERGSLGKRSVGTGQAAVNMLLMDCRWSETSERHAVLFSWRIRATSFSLPSCSTHARPVSPTCARACSP